MSKLVIVILMLNFYLQGMRQTISSFRSAAGICYEDRFVPIIESIVNIVASIILLKIFGLAGVFMGTILSTLVLHLWSFPKYVFKRVFNKPCIQYIIELLKYFVISAIVAIIVITINSSFAFSNQFLEILKSIVVSFVGTNAIYIILFRKTEEFTYYKNLLYKKFKKIKIE